ncbi:MAG: dehydrogenase [Planctomycetaceae bacterium]|nr:dehydrogenase [Planctomycetaceae bacterium]
MMGHVDRSWSQKALLTVVLSGVGFFGSINSGRVACAEDERDASRAISKLHVAQGLELHLFAAEPLVRQPVTMTVDRRGRVWVIQYLQYPEPAGLKKVSGDRYDRIRYDRLPEPPPRGPRGADRVTILEDTDGDGQADAARDFVSGLNLASGLALGHGGVWVLQSPYLLFYPDRDQDDRPDGDPEVRLVGFGLDDAHSVANSLQWGPDGWLYGAHGSTVNANVRGIRFQQGIWRYHPRDDRFELFSEGGGNTYGLDFDRFGNAIAGTNWGIPGLHQMQGAYHVKIFGKHGALHNPHAFGYFPHMPHHGAAIGKLSVGGVFYEAAQWPERFHGKYLTANPLNHALYSIELRPRGSTFSTHFHERVMWSDDTWFQPVDLALDVDGALLVADWYDGNINYQMTYRNRENFDSQRGRIYRISVRRDVKERRTLRGSGDMRLLEKLRDVNITRVRQTLEDLNDRADPLFAGELKRVFMASANEREALHLFWALNHCVRLARDRDLVASGLTHRFAAVRAWTVRLLGDQGRVEPAVLAQLVHLARTDSSLLVRTQLACTAKRLPGTDCLAIVKDLLRADDAHADPYLPMLLWWAVESKAVTHGRLLQSWLRTPEFWQLQVVRDVIIPRLARRYAALGGDEGFGYCAQLLSLAPSANDVARIIGGMEQQLQGLKQQQWPAALEQQIERLWEASDHPVPLVVFSLRMGSNTAFQEALKRIVQQDVSLADRQTLVQAVGAAGNPAALTSLTSLLVSGEAEALQATALSAIAMYAGAQPGRAILDRYASMNPGLRGKARQMLYRRAAWVLALLRDIDAGKLAAVAIPYQELPLLLQHNLPEIRQLVEKHWGKFRLETPESKRLRMLELGKIVLSGVGDHLQGKKLFHKTCGKCHRLHGAGEVIGPDLTPYPRHELVYLLLHTVDPNAVIRPAYQTVIVVTADANVLTGRIVEQSEKTITVLDAKNNRSVIARDSIEKLRDGPQSLMPEKQFAEMKPAEIRDLFAFLQSKPSEPIHNDLSSLQGKRIGFEVSASEWELTDNGAQTQPRHVPTGGNPGGWLQLQDVQAGRMAVVLPQTWVGDLSGFLGGVISFDARTVDAQAGAPHKDFGLIEITGAGQTVSADAAGPGQVVPGSGWSRYQLRLSHDTFRVEPRQWAEIMSDVQRVLIRVEGFSNASEVMGLDNVSLTPTASR